MVQGGTVPPPCNRKGRTGNPPPKDARASALSAEGTSASDTSGGAGLAAPVPGHVSFSNVGESSPWPGHRLCFESASTGQAEPSPVFVSVGFRLRGWGILQCRFAGRRTRSIVPLRLRLRGYAR